MMGVGKGNCITPLKNCNFWYQFVGFLGCKHWDMIRGFLGVARSKPWFTLGKLYLFVFMKGTL